MGPDDERADLEATIEERRFSLEENRQALENSFARKWLPTLATVTVGLIAGMFSFVQHLGSLEATRRASIEANVKNEREWGFKVVEMYFDKHDMFDLTKNSEQAALNLQVLAAVAPTAVQGVLNAERSRIPPPSGDDDANRLDSLAAVAGVQDVLSDARQSPPAESAFSPSAFTVYIQYPEGGRDTATKAQGMLRKLGYHVPGIERVGTAPSRLQVRYYRPEQRSYAGGLARELGQALDVPAGADSAILVTSAKQLPGGILEVWLPRNPS